MKPEPFRIAPAFVPRLWGARSLAPLYAEKTNLPEPIGEVWLTGLDCKVATGPFAGQSLGEAWRAMPAEWRGTRFAPPSHFPILVKFIFPADKLSIQVHPDDAYAAAHEPDAGGRGKTEMWHAVRAQHNARVLLGLKPGVDKDTFRQALASQQLEELFQAHIVRAGDTFFVPAGTPHTIGPGMVLCEVQEYSDLTYRVYDYGRVDVNGNFRELHVEKALEVMNFSGTSRGPFQAKPGAHKKDAACVEYLAACRYFAVEKWVGGPAKESTSPEQFELLTMVEGSGVIQCDRRGYDCSAGETWFLPASLGEHIFTTLATALRIYVPDMNALERMLVSKGYTEEERKRFIFS